MHKKTITVEVTVESEDETFSQGYFTVSKVVANGKEVLGQSERFGTS